MICKKCGYDHENPGSMDAAVRVLACALPEHTFYTRKGKVPKTKKEELKAMSREI